MNEILLSEKIFNYNFYSKQGRVTDKEDIQDWILELGLGQYLNEIKIFGILLILIAVIFSQLASIYDKKK